MKNALLILISLFLASPAFAAVNTAETYSSGILVLLFVGFCSLIIVAQIVPALLMLFGAVKAIKPSKKQVTAK